MEPTASASRPGSGPDAVDRRLEADDIAVAGPGRRLPKALLPSGASARPSATEESFMSAHVMEAALVSPVSSKRASLTSVDALVVLQGSVPPKRHSRFFRHLRHTILSVYRRLFSIVFLANIAALVGLIVSRRAVLDTSFPLSEIATASAANFLVAILIRQDYVINLLFHVFRYVPHSAPLRLRRVFAKVYEFGGVHSGAAVAGAFWFKAFCGCLVSAWLRGQLRSAPIAAVSFALGTLLTVILVFAYPTLRYRMHNTFELTHRFAGWTVIGLFWALLFLLAHDAHVKEEKSLGSVLARLPAFWLLLAATFHIILPWLFLRKADFRPQKLSEHALRLHFDEKLGFVSALSLSESPLREWHPFAALPSPIGPGGSVIISHAGDWTQKTIQDPKTQYWLRGRPRTGVLSMACIFKTVALVTTGSGIGPVLAFLTDPRAKTTGVECRILWSTKNPIATWGQEISDLVLQSDPKAIILDTHVTGRPDLVAYSYQLYVETGAEAVFVISNRKLTRKVVYGLESRGVPAFGPVWDS